MPQITPTKFPAVLVMYDPDAPASKVTGASWLHHLRLYKTENNFEDIVPYMPPSPPKGSGIHHYITEIYKIEKLPLFNIFNLQNRSKFRIEDFRGASNLPSIPTYRSEFTIDSK